MNDKDTIYRQAAIDIADDLRACISVDGYWAWTERLKKLPSAQPERKKGEWVKKNDDVCYWYECSVCGEKPPLSIHRQEWHSWYCPNCGAEMTGGDSSC